MNTSEAVTKDPVCGMRVDRGTALHAERDGRPFYFCSDSCRKEWLAMPPGDESKENL